MRFLRMLVVLSMLVGSTVASLSSASAVPKKPVITVPAGDVAALYSAVYEGASPRPNVVIWLEESTFTLNPAMGPHDGRLVLGEGTELRSSLVLQLDGQGVPTGSVSVPGAVIDTSMIFPATPIDPGAVTVGRGGTVAGISMTNPYLFTVVAIDIPESGLVERVLVEGHFEGARLYAPNDGGTTTGTIRETVMRSNGFLGIAVIQANPITPVTDSKIRLNLERNLITGNDVGVFIFTGTTGSQRTRTTVHASNNIISDNAGLGYLIQGASDGNMPNSGANDNSTRLVSRGDSISGSFFGVGAAAAVRLCSPLLGGCVFDPTSPSNRNSVTANLINTTFADNDVDVDILGVFSEDLGGDGDPVGEGNTIKVILANPTPTGADLVTSAIDCLPFVDPCLNQAKILPTGN